MRWYIGCCDQEDTGIGPHFLAMNESLGASIFLNFAYDESIGGIRELI